MMKRILELILLSLAGALLAGAPAQEVQSTGQDIDEREIVTVLPKDRIRAIDRPLLVPATRAVIDDDDWVIGVEINGEARAYSTNILNHHEIVNDTIGGKRIAVTW